MSWRVIFGILIVAAAASAWGGLRLGDWLIANGPVAPVTTVPPELAGEPVLDADGRPYQAQPPQPLVNGQLGRPETTFNVAWQVAPTPIDELINNGRIALATTQISLEEAVALAQMQQEGGLQGLGTVGNLAIPGTEIQPIEMSPTDAPVMASQQQTPTAAGNGNWQAALKRELNACSALGFFERPSCAWAARNKYCEPNNAWGRTSDCPAKSF
ncbi:MAG: hypothetical protein AB7E12_06380 [Burkholderiaceae bacterium]